MSANDSNGYFVELGEYSLILAKANLGQRPRAVEELREVWLGDNAGVDSALKELKPDGEKAKAVALLRLKNRALIAADAALAKKVASAAAVEDHLKEALGAENYPANWAWVSQKDGRAPDANTPWLLDATTTTNTDEGVNKITGWAFDLLRCESASLALVGSLSTAAKTAQVAGPVLLCDVSETRTFLIAVGTQGVTGSATIPTGFDAMAEATQSALGLKFRGSAARLMFNESYDFTDSAAKIVEPLAVAIRTALPTLGAAAPSQLVCAGVLARQTWLTQALAAALNLKLFSVDAAAWATAQGLTLGSKVAGNVSPTWLGVLGAVAAYDPRNPSAALPWNPILTNTPVAPAPIIPAIIQEPPAPAPAAKPAVVITPPVAPKAPEPAPTPAIKPEPAKAAPTPAKAPEPVKPAVVITPPPKPVEPPKPVAPAAKTPPPPAKPVEPKPVAKPETKPAAPAPAAKPTPPKPEPAKPTPAAPVAAKPTLAPAPAPAVSKPATTAPFQQKKSSMGLIIAIVAGVIVLGGGGFLYKQSQDKEKEAQRLIHEQEQRAAAEAAARRAAEEEAAQKAALAEKARIEAEDRARQAAAEQAVNARGSLILNTNPPGATVAVGELAPRPSPIHLKDLRLGKYTVTITLPGYDTEQRDIDIKANEVTDLGAIPLHRQIGSVELTSDPAGLDYELKPAGALFVNPADVRKGQTPATLSDVPVGSYTLTILRPNWPSYTTTLNVERNGTAKARGTFVGGTLVINSNPPGATVMRDQTQIGTTPLTLTDLQPGDVTFTLTQRGLEPATVSGKIEAGKTVTLSGTLLDTDRVMRPSELDERPVPVTLAEPELSGGMRSEGGSATIEFVVNKDGTPSELKILSASNPNFGRACLTAAAKWKFRPGMVRGKPVRTRMTAPFKMQPES